MGADNPSAVDYGFEQTDRLLLPRAIGLRPRKEKLCIPEDVGKDVSDIQ